MKFIMLVGIPGSGKSTAAKELISQGFECFNADDIRQELYGDAKTQGDHNEVFEIMFNRLELALLDEKDIVIDNTNVRKSNRRTLIAFAHEHLYTDIELWLFDVPFKTCLERNNKRARVVPEDVLVNMQRKLEETKPLLIEEGIVRIFGADGKELKK